MLKYIQHVKAVVEGWGSVLTDSQLEEVWHFIRHDEPAEALRSLAWILHERGSPVAVEQKQAVLALVSGLVDDADMPASFLEARTSG